MNRAGWKKVFTVKSNSKLSCAGGSHPIKVVIPREIDGESSVEEARRLSLQFYF